MQSKLKHQIYTQLPEDFTIFLDEASFLREPELTQRFVDALQTMRKQWPSVRIHVEKFDANRMEEVLRNGTADLCIGLFEPTRDSLLCCRYLSAQRMNLVLPRQESWQGSEPTQEQMWDYLRHNQIFMMDYDSKMTSKLIVWLSQHGVVARISLCTQSWFLQLHLQLKDGAGIVPDHRLYQEFRREDICVIPMDGLSIDRYIAWNQSNEHFMLPLFMNQFMPEREG
jgi:DNA-binding transcriptional LysR family regulator